MKKLYFLFFALLTTSLNFSQGTETFDNFAETGSSYADGTFTGQDGSTWTYVQSRGDQSITGKSIMLGRNRTPQAEVYSGTISGGVGTISFNYEQAFSTNVNLNVLINDVVYGNVTSSAEAGVTKASGSITVNQPGDVVIKFTSVNNSDGQVTIDDITWTGYTGSATPTISTSAGVSGLFYYETLGPSSSDTFTVSGINLTNDITVTAPTNFEVSLDDTTFNSSETIAHSGGTVNTTTIYVRLVSGLTNASSPYSDNITVLSTGASSKQVPVSGAVGPDDPLISYTGGLSNFSYTEGSGPSTSDSFDVSGMFLTDDITVMAPANFEVSVDGVNFFSSGSLTPDGSGDVATTTIYVRLASGLSVNSYSGNVELTSPGAIQRNVAVTGDVNPAATCPNVGDIIITEIMQNPASVADSSGEYFEVYNTTGSAIDMIGWTISDAGTDSHTITSNVSVPAMGYAVFGINSDSGTNGGVTVDYQYSGISLSNGADEIILTCSSTIIDEVYYDGGPNFPDPSGISMELSTTAMNSTDNDNGANWGESTGGPLTAGDSGTPGSGNSFTLSNKVFAIKGFKLYPNPTNLGYVNILSKSNSKMDVSVFDIIGKEVLRNTVTNNTLDVSALKTGVYILKVSQEDASSTKRLVIK
ncbi:T9SS type A sorting domain-containing protein [Seonamhaeicola aphaedonensis]|uniref:Putative secreted protein (Por secretion system target) n=1 Tax=Seonamhaeicola aphaedonensis TaxID=1461338 RepID=A0A3D9H6J8_9FLAO|nr:lamin tail domain-containing protein [Seonamhaeicola aphaedonensis]RED44771.1 putative secreted protein (Por secretion system target) [Seonamhaeicola aphaedonensis]